MPSRPQLQSIARQGPLRLRTGEGYAFYALYPENYFDAARRSGLGRDTCVIGIRSIGTGLAAVVATALDAPQPVTVRPVGHPFERELRISDGLAMQLLSGGYCDYAIVDEGPGLSGSSFAAVINWLIGHGVAPQRIHIFPSHAGEPGAQASPMVRKAWALAQKHPADENPCLSADTPLHGWFNDITGPPGAVIDISGGRWRQNRTGAWPPSERRFERRKFLLRADGRTCLAKFAGLGEAAHAKFEAAKLLSLAGLIPGALALRHGFMLEERHEGRPVDLDADRAALLAAAARYTGIRARMLKPVNAGASPDRLIEMASHNAGLALGEGASHNMRQLLDQHAGAMRSARPVYSDNRMHAWEWIVTTDGRILKADALDHAFGHDLIGCQDIAWDIAGAIVELRMNAAEARQFMERTQREAAMAVNTGLVAAMIGCYLAFQLGSWTLAAQSGDHEETARLQAAANGYKSLLSRWIAAQAAFDCGLNSIFSNATNPSSSPPIISPNSAPAPNPPAATR
jgi:hypothetical protein